MHCEGGGQFVVTVAEAHALTTADSLLLVKETECSGQQTFLACQFCAKLVSGSHPI